MVCPWGSNTDFLRVTYTRALGMLGLAFVDEAAGGHRELDPGRGQAVVHGLVGLGTGQALLRVVAGPEHHLEVYGGFAEARNEDDGLAVGVHAWRDEGGATQDRLHLREVAAEGHS